MLKFKQTDNTPPPLDPNSTLYKLLHNQAIGAVVLLLAAGTAFFMANSKMQSGSQTIAEWYDMLWHLEFGIHVTAAYLSQDLHAWVNDGLMAIFFLLVGLEIKRELLVGELASFRKAMLPIAAAIGGMLFPALIYAALNWGQDSASGWGIPMATDIAFAAGVIGLMSRRVPPALAVFLIALAIVDDLGAVAVIAFFYTDSISTFHLSYGLGVLFASFLFSLMGFRSAKLYTFLAVVIWLLFLKSGVHATVAGVLFAFTIPASARYDTPHFIGRINTLLKRFDEVEDHVNPRLVNAQQQRLVRAIEAECIHVEAPLQRMENKLHPLTAFIIIPLFAFANAGVQVDFSQIGSLILEPVTLGVILGLVLGKQMGIMLFSGLAVALKLAELPQGVQWKHIYAVSWLAGIGFTMSLFIAQLAFTSPKGSFDPSVSVHIMQAKVGILLASTIAGIIGIGLLYWTTRGNAAK